MSSEPLFWLAYSNGKTAELCPLPIGSTIEQTKLFGVRFAKISRRGGKRSTWKISTTDHSADSDYDLLAGFKTEADRKASRTLLNGSHKKVQAELKRLLTGNDVAILQRNRSTGQLMFNNISDAMLHKKGAVVMTEAQSHRSDDARKTRGPKETHFTRNAITKARSNK